ncbi:MAG: KpsF/GutQ family sugar-phosphate isomerase [Rubritalea sp.]|uniref:KpsF/GutQ family sugar-phosphate isomerase n=1 Tax=Rubritalea sp. TaxID=2109375 RepID=UPI003241CDA4
MNNSELIASGRRVVKIEIDAIQSLLDHLDNNFALAVNALADSVSNKGKVVVIGIGKSGNIGHKIAATLNSTGSTAVVLNSQNALHGDLGIISDGDTIIALSFSGETVELLDLLPHIKRFDVQIISITKSASSSLAKHSDIALITPIDNEACPLNLAPTSSSTAALVMGDALAMALLESRGFTETDFAKFHPGGALGRALLTSVKDIMRSGDQIAKVSTTASVTDTLATMSMARTGSAIITDDDGTTLRGVFTHGDFARNFQLDNNIGQRLVVDFMHTAPITILQDALAAEAVKTFEQMRVDDLIVVDIQNKVVGLVDSQDLARLKIV